MIAILLVALALPLAAQRVHEICAPCHNQHFEDFQQHTHFKKGLSCDACHGPSKGHREAGGNQAPDRVAGPVEQPAVCGACHTWQRTEYESSRHGKLVAARSAAKAPACTICHGSHQLRMGAATERQCRRCHESPPASCSATPAARDARVSCANCHSKHTLAARR